MKNTISRSSRRAAGRPPLDHTDRAGQGGGGQGNLGEFGRMFFTRIGFIFAHLFFWYGLFGVAFSIYQGLNAPGFVADQSAAVIYLTREVGESMTHVFMGLALGVLCEISSNRSNPDSEQA